MSQELATTNPDAHLDELVAKVRCITENWAKRHDLWNDSVHKDPIEHYNSEPGKQSPILLLCSDGPAMTSLEWDDEHAIELRGELEQVSLQSGPRSSGQADPARTLRRSCRARLRVGPLSDS